MLHLLYAAVASTYGICISCENPVRVRQKLYKLKREQMDPTLDNLSVIQSPGDPSHLWIIKKVPDNAP